MSHIVAKKQDDLTITLQQCEKKLFHDTWIRTLDLNLQLIPGVKGAPKQSLMNRFAFAGLQR